MVQKQKIGHALDSICSKAGPKHRNSENGRHYHAHTQNLISDRKIFRKNLLIIRRTKINATKHKREIKVFGMRKILTQLQEDYSEADVMKMKKNMNSY